MLRRINLLIAVLVISVVSIVFVELSYNTEEIENEPQDLDEENEERPNQPLSGVEKEMFLEFLENRQSQTSAKSLQTFQKSKVQFAFSPIWGPSSYANGRLQGTWSPKIPHTGWNGYRTNNSAYDSLRNVFYVITHAGHLYKMEYTPEVKWELLNHKEVMNPDNDLYTPKPIFIGTLLPDSIFRLIRSNDNYDRMEYSDDEGRTWNVAVGATTNRSWVNSAFEISNNGQKRIIVETIHSNKIHIYISDDNGQTYTESSLDIPTSTYDARMVKPYYTNDAYVWVWNKSSKAVVGYKYNPSIDDFETAVSSSSTVAGNTMVNAFGTYLDGQYFFYLISKESNYLVYYSSDGGTTWTEKNKGVDKPIYSMSADNPNILMGGYEDMKLSTDYGTTWDPYGWKLGWDLHSLNSYKMAGGKYITLAGLDFGCYVSETPEDKNSYTWCNDGARYAMHYDAVTSENYNSIYMGNQDRGTTAYLDSGTDVQTIDVDGTDVLRVCFANREASVWSWFYYGRIKHRYNFPTGKPGEASYDGLGNWWAAPIIASPDPSEDAIYAAYGSNLKKFRFIPESNVIVKTEHPFNFETVFKFKVGGFGYSELNRDLWYVALENGSFIYSEDAGNTWAKSSYLGYKPRANDQALNYFKNHIVIKASQIDTNKVFYAGVGNYFLISNDRGKTFTLKNKGLNIYRMRDFDLSPDEKFVFAACGYGGAWVYSVDDDYWYQMSDDPIPSVDFSDVQFIGSKNCVRFSTYGSGILDFTSDSGFYPVDPPSGLSASINAYPASIGLSWTDTNADEDGFYIERATDSNFVCIDTIGANATTYNDSMTAFNTTYYYRVKAFKNNTPSFKSNLASISIPKEGFLTQDNWSLISFSSQEINGEYSPAKYAIDNNKATYWHTEWDNAQPAHPHYLAIDLGIESEVAGFRYLPRQDGGTIGSIANYELYVTNDTLNWGTPVSSGQFGKGSEWKEAIFDQATNGRYVKLVALSDIGGTHYTSAAEIAVLYQPVAPDAPINISAMVVLDSIVRLSWKDNSINELGYVIEQYVEGDFITIDSVKASQTTYFHRGLPLDSTYKYRVRAYNNAGVSEPSDFTEVTIVQPIPDAPISFEAVVLNNYDVQLTWADNSDVELGYIIEQSINGTYVAIDTVDLSYTSYFQDNLPPDSTYWYRVRAYNNTGVSDPTDGVGVFIKSSGVLYVNTDQLKVFPNPCTTQMKIELPVLKQRAILRVIDLNGKTYISMNINPGSSSINLSVVDIPEGIYLIDLYCDGFRVTQKIRKE